jgi:hypothetical protein
VNLGILIVADLAGKSVKQELVQLASSLSVDVIHFFDARPMDLKSTVENQEIKRLIRRRSLFDFGDAALGGIFLELQGVVARDNSVRIASGQLDHAFLVPNIGGVIRI